MPFLCETQHLNETEPSPMQKSMGKQKFETKIDSMAPELPIPFSEPYACIKVALIKNQFKFYKEKNFKVTTLNADVLAAI